MIRGGFGCKCRSVALQAPVRVAGARLGGDGEKSVLGILGVHMLSFPAARSRDAKLQIISLF